MSNVLITITNDYYPSNTGFAQAFLHLHNSILKNGICDHVYVLSEGKHFSPDEEKITVYDLPKVKGMHYLCNNTTRGIITKKIESEYRESFSAIEKISRSNNVQMILIESMFMAWLIPILKKKFKSIPIICRIHGTGPEYTAFYREMEDIKFRDYLLECVFMADNISATTKYYFDFFRDYYKDYGKFMDKEFFLLPNTTLFEDVEMMEKEEDKIYLLQLGRMDKRGYHQKGFQDTVKALMYIENILPQFASKIIFTTIGAGDRENEFLARTQQLKYVNHIHYSKMENSEVKKVELQSDLILLPSRCEGMSMFATEAVAAGKPLICTKGNGLESLCIDGYNGFFVSEYDYIRIAERIIEAAKDKENLIRMGNNSKQLYEEVCSYKAVSNKYELIARYLNDKRK